MSQASSTFAFLFPGNALVNSLLATSYISIIPNLLLYFVPPDINASTLSTLVHFAVGSLLGDVFLHLLPHAFVQHDHSHDHHEKSHHHQEDNESHRTVLIGLGIFAGIFFFYAADKCMRVYLGRAGHQHNHNHQHHHHDHQEQEMTEKKEQIVNQVAVSDGLRQRNSSLVKKEDKVSDHNHAKSENDVRASTYLNLLADFTHNLTDGIAMAASFYASPAVGATTAVAVFFHEIPHEISDYAILLQSGFSKKRAMMAQFTTAIGAYIGTFIGIFIEEMAIRLSHEDKHSHHHHHHGLWDTTMTWGDLVIPATAGGFLYIATVGVIPELLEAKANASRLQPIKELLAMVFGIGLMTLIALNETHSH